MKHLVFSLILSLALPLVAQAQNPHDINIMHFKVSSDPSGIITLESARKLDHLQWYLGGMFSYAYDPLTITLDGKKTGSIVGHQVMMDLAFSMGVWKYFQLGAQMQAIFHQRGDKADELGFADSGSLKGLAISDFRLLPKVVILRQESAGFGLAFLPILTFPTANANSNAGDPGFMFEPRVIGDIKLGNGIYLAGSLGYRLRKGMEIDNLRVDDEIVFGFGAEVPLLPKISLVGEVYGAIGLKDSESDPDSGIDMEEVPVEAVLGGRWRHDSGLIVTGGLGRGLTSGYGTPGLRVFVGAGYVPPVKEAPKVVDSDGDGIPDDQDECPQVPGVPEYRGCPVPDADGDGIPDDKDLCPDVPGTEEFSGCPKPDTDGDSVCDPWVAEKGLSEKFAEHCTGTDLCPDVTGTAEFSGCPNPDTDGDGICDPWVAEKGLSEKFAERCTGTDKCPEEAGVPEEEGCPKKEPEKVVVTKEAIVILDRVLFATAKATLLPESHDILDRVADVMKKHEHIQLLEVHGHTDDVGGVRNNQKLSEQRAKTVLEYLVNKGIARDRLQSKGFGQSAPLKSCRGLYRKEQDECRANNRRVEFKILKQAE